MWGIRITWSTNKRFATALCMKLVTDLITNFIVVAVLMLFKSTFALRSSTLLRTIFNDGTNAPTYLAWCVSISWKIFENNRFRIVQEFGMYRRFAEMRLRSDVIRLPGNGDKSYSINLPANF